MNQTQTTTPIPATIELVVNRYIEIVNHNDAAQNVLCAINDPLEQPEIVYELCDTARDLGFFPSLNMDAWWTALRATLPEIQNRLGV